MFKMNKLLAKHIIPLEPSSMYQKCISGIIAALCVCVCVCARTCVNLVLRLRSSRFDAFRTVRF